MQVDDLTPRTLAGLIPTLTLAAHGLSRELAIDHRHQLATLTGIEPAAFE